MYDMDSAAAGEFEPTAGGSALPGQPADDAKPTRLQDFLNRAHERKDQQAAEPERFHGSWFNPDPAAATQLAERHPVAAFIDQTKPRRRAKRRHEVLRVLSLLTGRPKTDVTWEDVLAYAWHHVGPDEANSFYYRVKAAYPNRKTRHGYVVTLRSITRRCRDAKLIAPGRMAEIHAELPTTSKQGLARNRRRLCAVDIAALMAACQQDTPLRAARDSAIVAVFLTTGMRVCELVDIDVAHWDRTGQTFLLVDTKNGRDHIVPVDARVQRYLEDWLAIRGDEPGPLFVSTEGMPNRLTSLNRLSTHAVRTRVQLLASRAGIGHVGTHDFRRTVASTLLRTTDAALVGRLLNHASLASTLTYDLATEDEQRDAISTLPLPDVEDDTARGAA